MAECGLYREFSSLCERLNIDMTMLIIEDGIQSFNSSAVMICTYAVMVPLSKDTGARASARAASER